jgi:anti-sigma regulatory factor (Ser/Thr protein kinase)
MIAPQCRISMIKERPMSIEIRKKGNRLEATIQDDLSEVRFLRKTVDLWLDDLGIDDFIVMAAKLCVHETVNNSITHGYKKGTKKMKVVDVALLKRSGDLLITVRDFGDTLWSESGEKTGDDFANKMRSDNPRGRGLAIVEKLCKKMKVVNRKGYGTLISMTVDLKPGKTNTVVGVV